MKWFVVFGSLLISGYVLYSNLYDLAEVNVAEFLDGFRDVVTSSIYRNVLVFVEIDTSISRPEQISELKY